MHRGLASVLPCGGTSCFGCIVFPLAFLSCCQKCPKRWGVSCASVLEARNCCVVLQKHSIGNKKRKRKSIKAGINFRGTKWSIIGLLTFTRFFFLTCLFFWRVSLWVVGVRFCNVSLCACVVIRFFFFLSAYFTNHCDKTVTLIFISQMSGTGISPTDKPLFARSLPLLLLYNINIILLYIIHYPMGIVFWGKGSISSNVCSRRVLNILFYFCVFQWRESCLWST